jgi:ferric-dicitrate binding protein FerR (iron transport regulator)
MTNIKTNYNNYELDDFACDISFINYVQKNNSEDVIKWEKWFSQNHKNEIEAQKAKTLILHLHFKKNNLSKEFINTEWNKLSKRLELTKKNKETKTLNFLNNNWWKSVAAACLLLISFGSFYYFFFQKNNIETITLSEIIVPKGEIKKVMLPDGTLVFINSDSKLSYDNLFSQKTREVYLEGEAFFDVKHNPEKPFIVKTVENRIRVLGTAFNIYAYPNEDIYRASLERGKILISHKDENKEYELKVNQSYLLLRGSNQSKIFETKSIETYSSWKNGNIDFKNQSFTNILRVLERTHNIVFILQNHNLGNCKYTGNFNTKDDINTILGVIKLPTPFEYEIHNDTIIIN